MNKNSFAAFVLLITGLSGLQSVNADEQNIFFGINFSAQIYTHDDLSGTYTPTVALMRLGVDVNKYLGFEGRFGVGVTSDTKTESGESNELLNNAMMGAYAKGKLPVTSNASLYVLLGATSFDMAKVDSNSKKAKFIEDQSSPSAGFGLQAQILRDWLINAEFMLYSLKSNSRLTGIELGAAYLF